MYKRQALDPCSGSCVVTNVKTGELLALVSYPGYDNNRCLLYTSKRYLKEIYEKGQIPILVGGTGFYIQAVLYDIDFTSEREDTAYREQLEQLAKEHGAEYLHQMLEKVDAASAKAINPNNVKRVIRALEFYEKTGRTISAHNEQEKEKESPYNAAYFRCV